MSDWYHIDTKWKNCSRLFIQPIILNRSSCVDSPSQNSADTHAGLFWAQLSGIPQIWICHQILRQRNGELRTREMNHFWLNRPFRCFDLLHHVCFPHGYLAVVNLASCSRTSPFFFPRPSSQIRWIKAGMWDWEVALWKPTTKLGCWNPE